MRNRSAVYAAIVLVSLLAAPPAWAKPPLWDKKISGKGRFKVLKQFDGDAVLDRETGLVWERAPKSELGMRSFHFAACARSDAGGRRGWRLAEINELMSLTDPASTTVPFLPEGHPFDLGSARPDFWSASSLDTTSGYVLMLDAFFDLTVASNALDHRGWCVRGPGGGGFNE